MSVSRWIVLVAVAACSSPAEKIATDGPVVVVDSGAQSDASSYVADSGGSGAAAVHVHVPLTITYSAATKQVDVVASVTIGQTPVDTIVDTGSSGLRVLPGVLAASDIVATSTTRVEITYANGTQFLGVQALANVTLGGATTPTPIPLQLIDTVQCIASAPHCPAQGFTAATYQIKPDGNGHGYRAIMGTGMHSHPAAAGIGDPIAQLAGHPPFVVRLGAYASTTGDLEIGPTADELTGVALISLPPLAGGAALEDGTPAFDDWSVPTCVDDNTTGGSFCSPTLFDSGAAPTIVFLDQAFAAYDLPPGDQVVVNIEDPNQVPLDSYSFTVGTTPKPGLDEVTLAPGNLDTPTNLGTAIFFRRAIYFDHFGGEIGVLPGGS